MEVGDEGETSLYLDQADALRGLLADFKSAALQHKDAPMPTKALFDSDASELSAVEQAV